MEVCEQGQTHSFYALNTSRFDANSKKSLRDFYHNIVSRRNTVRKSSVSLLSWSRYTDCATGWTNEESKGSIPEGGLCLVQTNFGVQPAAYIMYAGHFSLGIKRSGPHAVHHHLVTNLRILELNLSPSIRLRGVVLNEAQEQLNWMYLLVQLL
jgi:hypothetical protein